MLLTYVKDPAGLLMTGLKWWKSRGMLSLGGRGRGGAGGSVNPPGIPFCPWFYTEVISLFDVIAIRFLNGQFFHASAPPPSFPILSPPFCDVITTRCLIG